MNLNFKRSKDVIRRLSSVALAPSVLLCAGMAMSSLAGDPGSGVWDCTITGKGGTGLALLQFSTALNADGNKTFEILKIDTAPPIPVTGGGRGGNVDVGRNPSSDTNSISRTNIFGYWNTTGSWQFDVGGNVVGFFTEYILIGTSTNFVTNHVSFVAKTSVNNQRLTALVFNTMSGVQVFRGVPQRAVVNRASGALGGDFSGRWQGMLRGLVPMNEIITLSPSGNFLNCYDVNGTGPGYALKHGHCLVSCQGKIAFGIYEFPDPTNYIQRATVGPLRNTPTRAGGTSRGTRETDTAPVSYTAWWLAP